MPPRGPRLSAAAGASGGPGAEALAATAGDRREGAEKRKGFDVDDDVEADDDDDGLAQGCAAAPRMSKLILC